MTRKESIEGVALFVFNGDPMCFIHVLLNALDLHAKGTAAKIIIEGAATQLIPELEKRSNPMHPLWRKALENDLVEGACKACSQKMGTDRDARTLGLALLDEMNGHPGMETYRRQGFEIITF